VCYWKSGPDAHPPRSRWSRSHRAIAPLGSWILGSPEESFRRRRVRVQILLTGPVLFANSAGAAVACLLVSIIGPGPSVWTAEFSLANFVAVPLFVLIALSVGVTWGTRRLVTDLRWATVDETPTVRGRSAVFQAPWRLARVQAALWGTGWVFFTALYGVIDPETIPKVACVVAFAGITVCTFCYLLTEFALRPVAARALSSGGTDIPKMGLTSRTVLVWVVGTGIPIFGLMLVALFRVVRPVSPARLAVSVLALGGVVFCFGLLLMIVSVRAAQAPIRSVQRAMDEVADGHLGVAVVVYDGTELGELQAGFNRMAEGLRERERIHELFGRYVGRGVASNALRRQPALGGEERDLSVLFVDIIDATFMAQNRTPSELVNLLNRFFNIVVEEVDRWGGFVNKFEGDAALAIFGAPAALDDHAYAALSAARSLQTRLVAEVRDCNAGIGVATGRVVAGNIGARERFEYTVIGDPVNESARLAEFAKNVVGRVVASGNAVDSAGEDERKRWSFAESTLLRGRTEWTRIAVPDANSTIG